MRLLVNRVFDGSLLGLISMTLCSVDVDGITLIFVMAMYKTLFDL